VWHNGIRVRSATLRLGEQTVFIPDIPERRLRCGDCSARWIHAPEGVSTRAHYQPCVIAEAVAQDVLDTQTSDAQVAQEHGCHRRTILRWIERVALMALPAELMCQLLRESGTPVIPPPPPVARPRRSASLFALGQRAVAVLCLLEALASHRGLCPPGLLHAPLFVPALVSPMRAAN
jgi:transposase-like protein